MIHTRPNCVEIVGPWPTLFELDEGQSVVLRNSQGERTIRLVEVTHWMQPDHWTGVSRGQQVHAGATIRLTVDGTSRTLTCRPGQLPVDVGIVRLYVETTREWAHAPTEGALPEVRKAVRLSAVQSGASWGPSSFVFPIADYRWRSSTYHNTWGALVPFNVYYHHRGEDLGAMPDLLDLRAVLSGTVVSAPSAGIPDGSNAVILDVGHGVHARYSHMNIGSIRANIRPGVRLARGETFARTGATWQGKPQQHAGPHFHFDLRQRGTPFSPYPTYVESYLRTFDDPMLAFAGAHGFTVPGEPVRLDGSRSVGRDRDPIVNCRWKLHDGRETAGETCDVQYREPGCYAEELVATTASGEEGRDSIMVYVVDPNRPKSVPHGWLHYTPSRPITTRTEVTFWNRLSAFGDATIDFGDGSPRKHIGGETTHCYQRPGLYTVTVSGRGASGEPASVKVHVRVQPTPDSHKDAAADNKKSIDQ